MHLSIRIDSFWRGAASTANRSLLCKLRYEPRLDEKGIGAKKHFPKDPCMARAWGKLEALDMVDKKSESTFASWLRMRGTKGALLLIVC